MKRHLRTGLNRLKKLQRILQTADAEHKRKEEPAYNQRTVLHPCGTPACAIGHWAFHHQDRWVLNTTTWRGYCCLRGSSSGFLIASAVQEFGITDTEAWELFEADGCGNAKTAKQAAAYIGKFIKRKEKEWSAL